MSGWDRANLPRPQGARVRGGEPPLSPSPGLRARTESAGERLRAVLTVCLAFAVSIAGPLIGAWLVGRDLGSLLQFPPRTEPWNHPAFSWAAWLAMAIPLVVITVGFAALVLAAPAGPATPPARRFPTWGWASVFFLGTAWLAAWTRFDWLSDVQRHTFTPLWIGFVLVVNALTYRRTGHCLLADRPAVVGALALVSGGFWWMFEILNRVAGNWHYRGIGGMGDAEYFILATVPFMTVLPAVASSWELLATCPRLRHLSLPRVAADGPALPGALLAAGVAGLVFVGTWPEVAFPFVWLGPAFVLLGLDGLSPGGGFLGDLRTGDWSRIVIPGLAALLCGACWETWNARSLAGWEYTVPYVDRFDVFAMPVLGYAGYVPFGITCGVVIDLVRRAFGDDRRGPDGA